MTLYLGWITCTIDLLIPEITVTKNRFLWYHEPPEHTNHWIRWIQSYSRQFCEIMTERNWQKPLTNRKFARMCVTFEVVNLSCKAFLWKSRRLNRFWMTVRTDKKICRNAKMHFWHFKMSDKWIDNRFQSSFLQGLLFLRVKWHPLAFLIFFCPSS